MSNMYTNLMNADFQSITVKVEQPEYDPLQTCTIAEELNTMRLLNDQPTDTYLPFKIEDNPAIDFIETSLDNFLITYQKETPTENLTKGAERQRLYRQKETEIQREKRLALARQYIKNRRNNETEQERYERLKKQRERIRVVRQTRKLDPDMDQIRRKTEAERMKIRRANETSLQRTVRLEKSRMYSKRRRENELYRRMENEKNRIAHQTKRADQTFRVQERQKDRIRKKMRKQIEYQQNLPVPLCPIELCIS